MIRRFLPGFAAASAAALILAACGGAPAVTDPREIVVQGLEATGEVSSFHLSATLDGTVVMAELGGGEMSLNGTSLEGDFDIPGQQTHMTFTIPAMLGFTGEVIGVAGSVYLKTSLTGPMWTQMDASGPDALGDATDPAAVFDGIGDFLDTEGVVLEKLNDTDCGEGSCYRVRLTVPAEALSAAGDELGGMLPGDVLGDGLVLDLLFDKEQQYLVELSTSLEEESVGSVTVTVTLSDFGADVSVEPPPSDQVTEGDLPFGF